MPGGVRWAGVDVGGRRKGFHLATVHEDLSIEVVQTRSADECAHLVAGADVVAIDSPCEWAPDDQASRPCERRFARSHLCGIRYTPNTAVARSRGDSYYQWIEVGLELWLRLRRDGATTIECFPTASWTAWLGGRGGQSRAAWTARGLRVLARRGIAGLDVVRNQDQRDAVAAALTARQWALDPSSLTEFGELVVPDPRTLPQASAL